MHILEIINSIESSGTQPFRLCGGPTDKAEVDFSYFEESSKILWLENFKLYLFKQFSCIEPENTTPKSMRGIPPLISQRRVLRRRILKQSAVQKVRLYPPKNIYIYLSL